MWYDNLGLPAVLWDKFKKLGVPKGVKMKNTRKVFGLAIITAIVFGMVLFFGGCEDLSNDGKDKGGDYEKGFTTIEAFEAWIKNSKPNTPDTAYNVKLKGDKIYYGFGSGNYGRYVGDILKDNSTKYVKLDLSDSTSPISYFSDCTNLIEIILSNNDDSIQGWSFKGCTNLKSVTIPNSVTVIYGSYTFAGCTSLTDINIPDSVTSIDHHTFSNCTGLKNLTIGSGIKTIASSGLEGLGAFEDCTNLTSVTIVGNKDTEIGRGAFSGCNNITSVTMQNGKSIGSFNGCTKLNSVTIGNGVKGIDSNAFNGCTSLTSITIPNSVTKIGSGAFYNCTGLTNVTIGNGVKEIEGSSTLIGGAFQKCTSLTSITIPNSVTNIGGRTFLGCTLLSSVEFKGTISSDNFANDSFSGDLRDKYLEGGPGTYTTTNPGTNPTWTKQ